MLPGSAIDETDVHETEDELNAARERFFLIVKHFEKDDLYLKVPLDLREKSYSRPRLIRYTYEYARSDDSKVLFLREFFKSMELPMNSDAELDFTKLAEPFEAFAEYLFKNFFIPMKASGNKTPQPSPAPHSPALRARDDATDTTFTTTPNRERSLRDICLERDHHRCVISRKFDLKELGRRYGENGAAALDDDNCLLERHSDGFEHVEVAHIIPHSLMMAGSRTEESQQTTLNILNMFDKNVVYSIEGVDIDRPFNAVTLTCTAHKEFGAFRIYFDAVPGQKHIYTINTYEAELTFGLGVAIPVTRKLLGVESIDPPSPRLLAIHSAIAHILHLSGAGEYIEHLIREEEKEDAIRSDGSTDMGHLMLIGMQKKPLRAGY